MNKKIRNMIVYTMIVMIATTIMNVVIINKINESKINKDNEVIEMIENENTNDILTMMCDFSNEEEIICE